MPQVLNFDTLTYDTVEITKRGRTWALRDDVPTKTLMRAFSLLAIQERLQRAIAEAQDEHPDDTEAALASVQARFEELERQAATLVGDIFRHSEPKITDATLLETFSFEELLNIVRLFFTIRSQALNQQPDASSASSAAATAASSPTATTSQKATNPNRATRRATAKRN